MNNETELKKFESMLKDRASKKTNQLYAFVRESRSNKDHKPQEIIAGLTKQLQVIHNAETIRQPRKAKFSPKKSNHSDFVNINMLSQDKQIIPDSKVGGNKFETQCFSDTQLINVIEKAEEVNVEAGFTQEFDTSFQGLRESNEKEVVEVDNTKNNDNIDEKYNNQKDKLSNLHTSLELNESNLNNETQDATDISMIPNVSKTSDCFEQLEDIDMPSSPIIQCSEQRHRNNTPMIFNLESFEKFESIAVPVIEENLNKSATKRIINTQMVDRELFLNIHMEPFLFERDKIKSPIINTTNNEIILQRPTNIEQKDTAEFKEIDKNISGKRTDSLKDEILFSSDEDEDYAHKNVDELSFTCALENPYLDEPDNLDQTMYVGFQTASDKAIQIYKNSFEKAKNILSDLDKNVNENNSFAELVDKHDSVNKSPILSEESNVTNNLNVSNVIFNECCDNNVKPLDNKPLEGFKTASNKVIKLSEKSLSRCLKVFKDINLEEQFNSPKTFDKDSKYLLEKQKDALSDDDFNVSKIEDDCILQEFENDDMSHYDNKAFIEIEVKSPECKQEINKECVINNTKQKKSLTSYGKSSIGEFPELEEIPNIAEFPFQGFKTAANKPILVSDKAVANSKKLFEDLSVIEDTKLLFKKPVSVSAVKAPLKGFQTANNIPIKVSQKSLALSKKVFEDIDMFDEISNTQPSNKINDATRFKGFQTASKKPVTVSKKALEQSKKVFQNEQSIFQDINMVDYENQSMTNIKSYENKIDNSRSKETSVKAVSPQKVHNLFPKTEYNAAKFETQKFEGFQTASKKKVIVSKSALEKSRIFFQNIDKVDSSENTILENGYKLLEYIDCKSSITETNKEKSHINDFDSVSKKQIAFEKVATETQDSFQDILFENKYEDAKPFLGFKTASNKKVKVSEKAIYESKKIFVDIATDVTVSKNYSEQSATEINKKYDTNINKEIFRGFQTASNKQIKITEAALKKSKLLLDNLELNNENDKEKDQAKNTAFKGFQTASNKIVEISAQALARSKILFDEVDNDSLKISKTSGFAFQTANKQLSTVSEDSLNKIRDSQAKNISGLKSSYNETLKSELKINVGFKTGSNRSVMILEEALNKSIELLDKDTVMHQKPCKSIIENVTPQHSKFDLENIINTQVLNNFEEPLNTEAFCKTPVSKRSGSPILSCPKAKRRKAFKTPYNKTINKVKPINIVKPTVQGEAKIIFAVDYKKNKRLKLTDLNKVEVNNGDTPLDPFLFKYEFDNLHKFEFIDDRNDLTDSKVMSSDGVERLFLDNVDRKIVPDRWIKNHLKLILWKLISYEVKFPHALGQVCTARNTLNQLKYRYDKELHKAERPALRKILEKDDIPSKTMVLSVVALYVDGVSVISVPQSYKTIELKLTDGWYTVMATIDKMLADLTVANKIKVGCKLVTNGAELLNCEQGIAPWENTSAVRLKLFGNSTRRARWHVRLGYHCNAAILTQLSTVKPEGGKVSKIRVFVARVYPTLYVEKFEDGSTVTRSERLENVHQLKYENERQALMEKAYEEVQNEFSDQTESQDSDTTSESNKRKMETGSQIAKFMKKCNDPAEFRSHLSESQIKLLQEHTTKRKEKLLQDIQTRLLEKINKDGVGIQRNVVSLVKIRIVGLEERNGEVSVSKAMMSIWKPSDAILEIVTEGAWIEVLNVVPTSVRYSETQISAGRQAVFKKSSYKVPQKMIPQTQLLQRTCFNIKDLLQNPSLTTDYNEVDTVGMIFLIEPSMKQFDQAKQSFQNIYLTDADKNMLCVNFWGGIKKFGYENLLHTGQVIAGFNLQKRAGNSRKSIPQYRVTEFTYFTKTPKGSVARNMVNVLENKLLGVDLGKFSEDCVVLKNNYAVSKTNFCDNVSPYRFNNSDYILTRNKIFINSPVTTKVSKNDDFNLTGLDFESTFKQETQELSPNTLKRKKKVMEKIQKLKRYGEPPPISPITMINKTKKASSAYKSPLLSKSDSFGVASEKEKELPCRTPTATNTESNNQSSPIFKINRTYVKNVNPVKLNFDTSVAMRENDSGFDHFAEDFESSPPLSLD